MCVGLHVFLRYLVFLYRTLELQGALNQVYDPIDVKLCLLDIRTVVLNLWVVTSQGVE